MQKMESFNQIPQLPPSWPRSLLIFTIIIFIIFVIAFFVFTYFRNNYQNKIYQLDNQIAELEQILPEEQQKNIILLEQKLNNLPIVLANHVRLSKLLEILESLTHRQVYFQNLTFSQEDLKLNIRAIASDKDAVAEAMSVFTEASDKFTNVSVSNISTTEGGQVNFNLELTFAAGLIKP